MADLDHFKQVNDQHGHLAGDAVLKRVGKLFDETLRSIDTAGRYGGEEFLIILDNTKEREAEHTAERIRKAVEESEIAIGEKTIKVTISIGVATINDTINLEIEQLIGMATKLFMRQKSRAETALCSPGAEQCEYAPTVQLQEAGNKPTLSLFDQIRPESSF